MHPQSQILNFKENLKKIMVGLITKPKFVYHMLEVISIKLETKKLFHRAVKNGNLVIIMEPLMEPMDIKLNLLSCVKH